MKKRLKSLIDLPFLIGILVTMPLLTVWHELGHMLLGKIFTFRVLFFFTAALVIPTQHSPCYPDCDLEEFLVHLAGPVFSWLLILISFAGFLRWRKKAFLLGLTLIGPFYNNFLGDLLATLFNKTELFLGTDEIKMAKYLGIPSLAVSVLFALAGTLILLISLGKLEKDERLKVALTSVLGAFIVYLLFWKVLAPLFAPDVFTIWPMLLE